MKVFSYLSSLKITYLMLKQDGKYKSLLLTLSACNLSGNDEWEEKWILFSSQILGKQQGRIYGKCHLSDHTCCPGKVAPALKYFPLILSLLLQVLQDFLHSAHTCYFCIGTLHQITPQIKTLQVTTTYEHHDIHIPIFSGCYGRYH